jgi:hypothetical protein
VRNVFTDAHIWETVMTVSMRKLTDPRALDTEMGAYVRLTITADSNGIRETAPLQNGGTCSPVEREINDTDMKALPGPEESHSATSGREALNISFLNQSFLFSPFL